MDWWEAHHQRSQVANVLVADRDGHVRAHVGSQEEAGVLQHTQGKVLFQKVCITLLLH